MSLGIVAKKCGMTRVFSDSGESIPVTVVSVEPNRITQLKTVDKDGYSAIQVTAGSKKSSLLNKAEIGHFAKSNVDAGRVLFEFRIDESQLADYEVGNEIGVSLFSEGQEVDVTGKSIGKGFAGTVKRHNFAIKDATHGNSLSHRTPGSIGQNQSPGKVFKGKKMSGQMGNVKRTAQTLKVVKIDQEKNVLLIKGSVPGSKGGDLIIKPAVKAKS